MNDEHVALSTADLHRITSTRRVTVHCRLSRRVENISAQTLVSFPGPGKLVSLKRRK